MPQIYCPDNILGHLNNGCEVGCLDGEITVISDTHVEIQYGTIAEMTWQGCSMTVTKLDNAKIDRVEYAALPLWLENRCTDLEFYTPQAASFYRNTIELENWKYFGGGEDD